MGPINLMKYICVTEIIHLKFGKSEMFLFGIQGGGGAFLGCITEVFTVTRCLFNVLRLYGTLPLLSDLAVIYHANSIEVPRLASAEVEPICLCPLEHFFFRT